MKTSKLEHESFLIDRSRVFLYYDQFRYRAKIPLNNIQYFRHVKTVKKLWEQLGYVAELRSFGLQVKDISGVKRFVEWIENGTYSKNQFSYRTSTNCVDVYTNDIEIIQDIIDSIESEKNKTKCEFYRVVDNPKTDRTKIYLVDPKHKYRVYFKWTKLSGEQIQEVVEFIKNNNISCSGSLENWIQNQNWKNTYYYMWDNFFIEFDEEMIITIMSLKFDNFFRKVCTVEKR